MLKGSLALVIRYVILAVGAAMAGAGFAFYGSDGLICIDQKAAANHIATALGLVVTGGATFSGGVVWRFIAKRLGGVT